MDHYDDAGVVWIVDAETQMKEIWAHDVKVWATLTREAMLSPKSGGGRDDRVGCGRPLAATRNAGSWIEQASSRKCNAFFPGYGAEVVEE